MLNELTKTSDNPVNPVREQTFLSTFFSNGVNLSAWLSAKPLFHRVGGQRLAMADLTDTLCAMRHALCDSDPNRGLPSVLAETDASGTITAYYVYGLGLISKIEGNNAYFYQYDGIGSTVAITDKNGSLKNQYAYDDFGNLATNSSETITNPFKYVGKFGVITDANDLLYMRARYYLPSVGRFINQDPIGGLNLYTYAGNNPLIFSDPLGLYNGVDWWLYESVVPGPYGQPVSERGCGGSSWGDPFKYTEEAGGSWKWAERIAFGISAIAALTAAGLMIANVNPWIGKIAFHPGHAGGPHTYPHIQTMIRISRHVTKSFRIP